MSTHRKRYSAELKTKVALEVIKGQKTTDDIASEYIFVGERTRLAGIGHTERKVFCKDLRKSNK